MRRRVARPFGQSTSIIRLASLLMALVVLFVLYQRLKDPATWQVFVDEKNSPPVILNGNQADPEIEKLVLGPNDQDEDAVAEMHILFDRVTDRAPLKSREMDAYWKLIDWSRTEPFTQLERRAKDDVPFTQLWEQPEKYRGHLIRLRLHVRRVLQYDAPENPDKIDAVCEAWGWTDESRSFPYVVVFPEPPQGLPIGTDVRAEIVFVGYFLKVMTYSAFDHSRGAPLLVGRARLVSVPTETAPAQFSPLVIILVIAVGIIVAGLLVWTTNRRRDPSKLTMLPSELSSFTESESPHLENPFLEIGGNPQDGVSGNPFTFDNGPDHRPS